LPRAAIQLENNVTFTSRPYALLMGFIDANDDTKGRWIVYHYRYDPERRERRHVIVACFDKKKDWLRFFDQTAKLLQEEKEAGTAESKEWISGSKRPAGHDRALREFREARRNSTAFTPSVIPVRGLPQPLTSTPPSIAYFGARRRAARKWWIRFRK
jgi:hypothetical protein